MRRRFSRTRRPELSASVVSAAQGEPVDEPSINAESAGTPELPEPPADATPDVQVQHWRDLTLREPGNVAARRRLARSLDARGEAVLAVEQLEAARGLQPEDIGLIVELAQAQTSLRRFDEAERELRRALKLHPESSDVHLSLGVISLRRGLYAQAELELKRAVELDPTSGAAYYYRGEALNQLSRVDEALEMLARAAQLQPDNPRSYYLMGIVYDKKSRPQEAATMYRKAREVGDG
jgi:tetratricopeptide (TPR) repeat protein